MIIANAINAKEMPISRLPPEILIEIIRHCIEQTDRLQTVSSLALVCKRWRDIIEAAPLLWSPISASAKPSTVAKAFRMVGGIPIDLLFLESSAQTPRGTFFELARGRFLQWRSLHVLITRPTWDCILDPVREAIHTRLEILRLTGTRQVLESTERINLLGGGKGPPCLKELYLSHIQVDLALLQLPSLKKLTLREVPITSSQDILGTLCHASQLERLEITMGFQHHFALTSTAFPSAPPILRLPHLTDLTLVGLPLYLLNDILSRIDLPNLQIMEIDCEIQEQPRSQFLAVGLSSHIPAISAMIFNPDTISVELSASSHYIIVIGSLKITLQFDQLSIEHFQETFDWLATHSARSFKNIPLTLELNDCDPDSVYLEWFTHRTTVTELILWSEPFCGPNLEGIIPTLGVSNTGRSVGWLLPSMEKIVTNLVWRDGNSDILAVLEKRSAAAQDDREGGTNSPKSLREIRLFYGGKGGVSTNTTFLNEVYRLGRGAEVYWQGKRWLNPLITLLH